VANPPNDQGPIHKSSCLSVASTNGRPVPMACSLVPPYGLPIRRRQDFTCIRCGAVVPQGVLPTRAATPRTLSVQTLLVKSAC
jgi:hypothetical protein